MSQKSSVPQAVSFVSQVLKRDKFVLINRAFGARHPPDLQEPKFHTPTSVAQLGSNRARDGCDLPHDAGQHANAVPEQGAVSRVVDIGLHHSRVHAHPSSSGHALVSGYSHHAFMNLLEHLRPERHAPGVCDVCFSAVDPSQPPSTLQS